MGVGPVMIVSYCAGSVLWYLPRAEMCLSGVVSGGPFDKLNMALTRWHPPLS